MNLSTTPLAATLMVATLSLLGAAAHAAVTADEAKKLGSTLTEFGATRVGNADGSIPPYTGGLTTPPADFKPDSGAWADPYKNEKPLYRIDAKNMAQYADKLSDGQKQLLKTNPSYYLDVYPTHRSAAYPDKVLKATLRNATGCKLSQDGLAIDAACRGGLPFPIAKTGQELLWNQTMRYQGDTAVTTSQSRSWVVDSSGKPTMTSQQQTLTDGVWYQTDVDDRDNTMAWRVYSVTTAPARRAGEATGLIDYIDKPRKAWSYTPGQRRIKLSPEFAYDTPVASMGGVTLFDELFVFSGKMDRFDFKLVGTREMFLPYNAYKNVFGCPAPEVALGAKHANPACERWELHRVNVVEAILKPGMRHAYSKRVYYLDEDLTGAAIYDAYDQAGALYRSMFNGVIQLYDKKVPWAARHVIYDFNKGMYAYVNDVTFGGYLVQPKPKSERELNPEAIVARETAR
jgi:hypothetical protein